MTTFVVRSPIHGYSGMDYEGTSVLERSFTNEAQARKRLRRCNLAAALYDRVVHGPVGSYYTDAQEAFLREMCENVSFHYRGPSTLVKRTVIDEQIGA